MEHHDCERGNSRTMKILEIMNQQARDKMQEMEQERKKAKRSFNKHDTELEKVVMCEAKPDNYMCPAS